MERSVMMSIVLPVEIEAESTEEAEKIYEYFATFLSKHPRMLMAKGKWRIRRNAK